MLFFTFCLIVLDTNTSWLVKPRKYISVYTSGLQLVVDWPIRKVGTLVSSLVFYENILDINTTLQQEITLLRSRVHKLEAIRNENQQLHALFQSSKQLQESKVLVAQLLAVDNFGINRHYTVNKGIKDGVNLGDAVLDANGVFGQVVSVSYYTSKVLLVVDTQVTVPVQNARNGLRAITKGKGRNNTISLINLSINSDIKKGDLFFTSGLDEIYPYGYPLGVVSNISNSSGDGLMDVEMLPTAHLHSSNILLLVRASKHGEA